MAYHFLHYDDLFLFFLHHLNLQHTLSHHAPPYVVAALPRPPPLLSPPKSPSDYVAAFYQCQKTLSSPSPSLCTPMVNISSQLRTQQSARLSATL